MSIPSQARGSEMRVGTIARVPVWIAPSYLVLVALVFVRTDSFELGALYTVATTLSLIVHELGHALAAREFGLTASIVLHGLGGTCWHTATSRRSDEAVVSVAGPAAGLLLGAIAWAIGGHLLPWGAPWWVGELLAQLAWIGLFWTLVNLMPVLPLDGGTLLRNRLEPGRGFAGALRTTRRVSVVAAVGGIAIGASIGSVGTMLMFGVLAYWNFVARDDRQPFPRNEDKPALGPTTRVIVREATVPSPPIPADRLDASAQAGTGEVALFRFDPGQPATGWEPGLSVAPVHVEVGPGAGDVWTVVVPPAPPAGGGTPDACGG
jgi:Zn-dependent protease